MKEIVIDIYTENQRVDKFLMRLLPLSTKGNIYRMLRKKVIVLNKKKAKGSEILVSGDVVSLFLSDSSLEKLQNEANSMETATMPEIIFEDENIVLLYKEAGVLSQKSSPNDKDTLNDRLLFYLKDSIDKAYFTPGIANRLDRNTSGLVVAGKNLPSAQALNVMFQQRQIKRVYETIVKGEVRKKEVLLDGYERTNKKTLTTQGKDMKSIVTPLAIYKMGDAIYSYVEMEIITGKTHQIRAQLSNRNHPILGDIKYGGRTNIMPHLLLHAKKMQFVKAEKPLEYLTNKEFTAVLPQAFKKTIQYLEKNSKKLE